MAATEPLPLASLWAVRVVSLLKLGMRALTPSVPNGDIKNQGSGPAWKLTQPLLVKSFNAYFMSTKTPNKLRQQLLELPFDAYLKVIALLLTRLGYKDVQLAGRTDWKGRNRGGGFDLVATIGGELSSRTVVAQVKQFDEGSRVFQRQADELRGVAIRSGAAEALLITSGPLSASIDQEGLMLPLAPVRVIGGDQLVELLTTHRIGITLSGTLDEVLFKRLEQEAVGNRQSDCLGAKSELLLTVAVKRVPRRAALAHRSS
jgi:hypothetical protein